MINIRNLIILFVLPIVVLQSCEKVEIEHTDNLEQFGILGKWGLQTITINGITDMSIRYDTIEFITDRVIGDLKGEFRSTYGDYEKNGQFELDTANNIIHFDFNSIQKSYEFLILGNSLTFTYSEDSQIFIEAWRKKE